MDIRCQVYVHVAASVATTWVRVILFTNKYKILNIQAERTLSKDLEAGVEKFRLKILKNYV